MDPTLNGDTVRRLLVHGQTGAGATRLWLHRGLLILGMRLHAVEMLINQAESNLTCITPS